MSKKEDEMITVRAAAKILDVSINAVHRAIKRNRIEAQKFGIQYMVSKESVLKYLEDRGPAPGRPGKSESGEDSPSR